MEQQNSVATTSNDLKLVNDTIAQLEQFLRDKDFFSLPRNGLILVLQHIQRVLLIIESKFMEISQINDNERNLNAQYESAYGSRVIIAIVLGLIVGGAVYAAIQSFLMAVVTFFFVASLSAKQTDSIYLSYRDKLISLEERKAELNREIDNIMASDYVRWLLSNTLSKDYMNTYAIGMFTKYLETGRADNLKEAINLYEEERHRGKMESMQQENIFATQAIAKKSDEIAKDVRKIRQGVDSIKFDSIFN